jgi:hypothetical protein
VNGRSGAHALSSGPSIGGQELIMKAAAVLDVPELLTTAEVASLLKVNRSTLSRWRSAGLALGSRGSQRTSPATSAPTWSSGCDRPRFDHSEAAFGAVVRCIEIRPIVR